MNATPRTIPPDAVRVWRGWKAPTLSQADYLTELGATFVPATVEMQIKIGLDAYVPTVPGGLAGKPDAVPDETAILYWDSQQTYEDGFNTLAVRTYTLTHHGVYGPGSRADFPLLFDGTLTSDQPCYLVDRAADWMHGTVTHVVGGPAAGESMDDFTEKVAAFAAQVQVRGEVEGGVVCVGSGYVVYWQLEGDPGEVTRLQARCGWSQVFEPTATTLPEGLWDVWPGMEVAAGSSFNMQFTRRWEAPAGSEGRPA